MHIHTLSYAYVRSPAKPYEEINEKKEKKREICLMISYILWYLWQFSEFKDAGVLWLNYPLNNENRINAYTRPYYPKEDKRLNNCIR